MKLTSMQQMIAAAVAIALVAVAAIVLLIVPMFGQLSELDTKQLAAESLVQQTDTLLKQLQEAKTQAPETQSELVRVSNQVPDNPELPSLIIELQDICNASGMKFSSITPREPLYRGGTGTDVPDDLNYTDVETVMNLEGTWTDYLDLLRRINGMTRAIRITSISISKPVLGGGSSETTAYVPVPEHPTLSITMTIKSFVMGNNGVMVSPASAAASGTATP
jgi:type IV pilus assembly protein PilO